MSLSFEFMQSAIGYVLVALPLTLFLTFFSVIVGLVIGFLLALIKINKVPVLSEIVTVYISFFRSIPLLVLLFLGYYGTPKLINFIAYGGERVVGANDMNNNLTAIIILTLYASAFLCEIVRGALSSVDMKQMEAAHSLGMTKLQAYIRIVIPQAVIVALPNYFNFVLAQLKGTSVVFTISVIDIMAAAKLQAEYGYRFIEAYILVAVIYIALSVSLSFVFSKLEKNAKRHMGLAI